MTSPLMSSQKTTNGAAGSVTISIVSHGHSDMLLGCLNDIADFPEIKKIILISNVAGSLPLLPSGIQAHTIVIDNKSPHGFAANHNVAFKHCDTPYFCILNPDTRFPNNPFGTLLDCITHTRAALAGPAILSPVGELEDSARHFPTLSSLLAKAFLRHDGRYPISQNSPPFPVEWLGGMCMLIRREDYLRIGGFDEAFFLYYEDVDICARLWRAHRPVFLCPNATVIHDARRASRGDFRYMRWHFSSMTRYFWKHWGRLPHIEEHID